MGCACSSERKIRYPHQFPLFWMVVHVGPDLYTCLNPALGAWIEPETTGNNMFDIVLSSEYAACITTWSLANAKDRWQPENVVEGLKALCGEKYRGAESLNIHGGVKKKVEFRL